MNPFDLFPQAVRHGRLSPGYLVDAKTGAGPTHDSIAVDVIIDNSYTLSEMAPFGQDGDILVYLKPSGGMFHMTPDEIAGGSIAVDDSPDGLPQGNAAGGRYHIMSVAYGRDQDTGHVIDYELTCKPEGAGT